ncbi:MAG: hypothetical protein EZS26_002459 [Candidatus Ordinivivax streblomastigis]|uniref:Uncharacterized protein n=1 Tax=Candidatus Ordinivivax streblomastigis TaxID=2540710 RepID=A0A5M8NZ03_9BACT|nr:MAG: hypothetical protein EZS26_002459 [Candidatus Ordinivivax streblomastigis]
MKVPKNDIVCLDLFNSISLAVKLFMLNKHTHYIRGVARTRILKNNHLDKFSGERFPNRSVDFSPPFIRLQERINAFPRRFFIFMRLEENFYAQRNFFSCGCKFFFMRMKILLQPHENFKQ